VAYPARPVNVPDPFSLPIKAGDLLRLEDVLRGAVLGEDPYLNEIATHLIDAGGKRVRPALTLASALLSSPVITEETLLGAVSVELVHLASLYHDDVMDEATTRRSVPSVNARFGNLVAIVAGDFLLARSAEIAASLGTEVAGLLAATLARLCQGQVAEVRSAFQIDREVKDYLSGIGDKTAALMSCACRIGGITSGLGRDQIEALTNYGEALGMVFQLRDDILDVIATAGELGKEPGQDLAEGIYTLPVQRALQDSVIASQLRRLLGVPLDSAERDAARALVAHSSGIETSIEVARHYADAAEEAAGQLTEGHLATALAALPRSLVADCVRPRC